MPSYPVVAMLAGAATACLLIAAKFTNVMLVTNRAYVMDFFFKPAALAIGLCAITFSLKALHDLWFKGRVLGRFHEILVARRGASKGYRLFLDLYLFFGILVLFIGAFVSAHMFLSILTGLIWSVTKF